MITYLEPDILESEVKWALGNITTNKASGGDGISAELFEVLKDDAVKVLHSVCQQVWKTQQWIDTFERIDAFKLWCWRRLLRVPWIARRSNQSILKEISPEYSLEGLILKLKL